MSFASFDLETTGLSRSDGIIEIGAVKFDLDFRVIAQMDLLIDPNIHIPLAVERLTGITDIDVMGAPSPEEGVSQLRDFVEGCQLVGHGAEFDLAFCAAIDPARFENQAVIDTLELARVVLPFETSHGLVQLAKRFELKHTRPHRALSDAQATVELLALVKDKAEQLPKPTLAAIRKLVKGRDASIATFFELIVQGDGSDVAVRPPVQETTSTRDLTGFDVAGLIEDAIGAGGEFARQDPNFELRESQLQMAFAVAQSLSRRRNLLVEAGTGVGKSLAYLVPLAAWTALGDRRAVVATHTINLQEQLANKEAPWIENWLGRPGLFAVLKGRSHYLSLRRWQRFLAQKHDDLESTRFKIKILCWLAQTVVGDRAELRLTSREEELWLQVQSDTDDCLGMACANGRANTCFLYQARRRAEKAKVVLTNHALALNATDRQGEILGSFSALLFDEAHHLEEVATEQFGGSLRLQNITRTLARIGGGEMKAPVEECKKNALQFFGQLKRHLLDLNSGANNVPIALNQGTVAALEESGILGWARRLRQSLLDCSSQLGHGPTQASMFETVDDPEWQLAATVLAGFVTTLDRALLSFSDGEVQWLSVDGEHAQISFAPTDVSEQFNHAIEGIDSLILTSATMTIANSFEFVERRLGLLGSEELVLSSPFDFLGQSLGIFPQDIPGYEEDRFPDVMSKLIRDIASAIGGRTLVLCTSFEMLKALHSRLTTDLEELGIAVSGQGLDGTRRQLLESFKANPKMVLLGTNSFWEGIDLPGDLLQAVVITKLPFPVPTDPLLAARAANLADPFSQLILPMAVLRFRQGFGRLIRRGDDRGVVVFGDSRVGSKTYWSQFVASLPPITIVNTTCLQAPKLAADFVSRIKDNPTSNMSGSN